MYDIFKEFLLVVCLGIIVECQGSTENSTYHENPKGSSDNIFLAIRIAALGAATISTSIAVYLMIKACRDRAWGSNAAYVNRKMTKTNEQEMNDINTFRSGYWISRYFQYGEWHGPHRFLLSFDIQSMKVTGSGSDDIGTFTIKGIYSIKTNRIGLKKKYKLNTGSSFENVGQHVTIRLSWNSENKQFEGKWHVYMGPQRHGKDQFELKFDEQEESSECEKL